MGTEAAGLRWFDCNARVGRWSNPQPEQFTDVRGLLAAWDRVGIEGGLAYHTWAWEWSPRPGNAKLLEEIAEHERIRPCFVALPPATREMEPPQQFAATVRRHGGAVRIFPAMHNWRLGEWCAGALFDALAQHGVPVLVDISQVDWDGIAAVLAAHPGMPLIVLNFYYRCDRFAYPLLERYPDLYLESNTYGVFRGVEMVCARFGADRLIFGTGLPELEVGGPMALVSYAEIADEDKAKIAGGTMRRLLGEVA
ncbi:MAG: amidohydrolase family protein [Armatimonadota bacterium]